ncbi:MAG: hypothetical protein JWN70_1314 [Planctomycetaceae bacterium]|nr:hypothetical protein [Planctomycetaceae bacterium]
MPRIFVGNFDFEHELTSGRRELSRDVQKLAADLVSAWLSIADADDVIWSPTGVPTFDFQDLQSRGFQLSRFISREFDLPDGENWELVPWGWTTDLVKWGSSHGWNCPAPPIDIVQHVNSRIFRWQLEQELGIALPGSAVLRSVEELVAHTAEHAAHGAGWVLKANFGMAGRERILGRGPLPGDPVLNWARKRFAQSAGLVFEPWVERVSEAGLQWNIPSAGEPQLLGITPLLTDASGTYRGSRLSCTAEELAGWQPAIEKALQVAYRVQQSGYWGPMGLDAMQYRTPDGQVRCRPLQDLNARYTMGRMALGLKRFVPGGCEADWLHDPRLVASEIDTHAQAKVLQTTARSWLVVRPNESR